jgi:hypothetical protein
VVLDRCTDTTPYVVNSFPYDLKVIEKKTSNWKNSYAENLELARNHIKGDVYAIIDADVYLSSDYFEKTAKMLKLAEIALVSGRIVFCPTNSNFLNQFARSWEKLLWASPSVTNLFYGCALLVQTQFLDSIDGFRDVPYPDTYLRYQAYGRKLKLRFEKKAIAFHFDDDLPLKAIINRQIENGKLRRVQHMSLMRTFLFALFRLKPFYISGWLTAFLNEKKEKNTAL